MSLYYENYPPEQLTAAQRWYLKHRTVRPPLTPEEHQAKVQQRLASVREAVRKNREKKRLEREATSTK